MKALALIVLSVIVMAVSLCAAACDCDAQWTWTPKAEHHAAACIVKAGDSGGSGTYVEFSDGGKTMRGVISAKHVTDGGPIVCIFGSQSLTGTACYDKFGSDVSWITLSAEPKGIKPIPFGDVPKVGDTVEIMGYGGPGDEFRHFAGKLIRTGNSLDADCPVTHGDSGGGWLVNGKLVGVMSAGMGGTAGVINAKTKRVLWLDKSERRPLRNQPLKLKGLYGRFFYRGRNPQSGLPVFTDERGGKYDWGVYVHSTSSHYHPIRRFLLRVITLGAIGPHPNRAQQWGLYPGQQQPGGT